MASETSIKVSKHLLPWNGSPHSRVTLVMSGSCTVSTISWLRVAASGDGKPSTSSISSIQDEYI